MVGRFGWFKAIFSLILPFYYVFYNLHHIRSPNGFLSLKSHLKASKLYQGGFFYVFYLGFSHSENVKKKGLGITPTPFSSWSWLHLCRAMTTKIPYFYVIVSTFINILCISLKRIGKCPNSRCFTDVFHVFSILF